VNEGGGFRLSRTSLLAMALALSITAVGVFAIQSLQRDQNERLLKLRASEVSLILTQAANAIPARLKSQGSVLTVTQQSVTAYEQAAAEDVKGLQGRASFAWLRPSGEGFVVLAAQGEDLAEGQVITGPRAAEMRRALTATQVVPGSVLGADRLLGFSFGPPAAPAGTVLYQQNKLGPVVNPSRQSSTDPFSDLDVALYGTPTAQSDQVLVGPRDRLPFTGDVAHKKIKIGTAEWLLAVKARRSLQGNLSALAPWFVLGAGVLVSLMIGAAVEALARKTASERASSETFQRSLLPTLPKLAGLDTCAQYVASSGHQQVGGDWYDVFEVADGRVGVVIGDVMGHDLVAASAMAQISSALRAFAIDGSSPAAVLDRLNDFVTRLEVTELVTVIYGVLSAAHADGSRDFLWSNAGHLPPLVRLPSGVVEPLAGGESILIGAPSTLPHAFASRSLPSGSSLLLFTDGLVELPGASVDEALKDLAAVVAGNAGTAEDLCAAVVGAAPASRDDICVLALCLT
jgi:hypothetical protein